ncbi:hypothetical protein S83_020003 [Arachis hypogaea]
MSLNSNFVHTIESVLGVSLGFHLGFGGPDYDDLGSTDIWDANLLEEIVEPKKGDETGHSAEAVGKLKTLHAAKGMLSEIRQDLVDLHN